MSDKKTAIITGASGGIGAGLVEAFLREGYNVVATSLSTWFSSMGISGSRRPLPKSSKPRSTTSEPSMFW